jgi:predicted amino acid-binding ACT domain protein
MRYKYRRHNQRIMGTYFVMTMLVDMKESKLSLEKVREELEKIGVNLSSRYRYSMKTSSR